MLSTSNYGKQVLSYRGYTCRRYPVRNPAEYRLLYSFLLSLSLFSWMLGSGLLLVSDKMERRPRGLQYHVPYYTTVDWILMRNILIHWWFFETENKKKLSFQFASLSFTDFFKVFNGQFLVLFAIAIYKPE